MKYHDLPTFRNQLKRKRWVGIAYIYLHVQNEVVDGRNATTEIDKFKDLLNHLYSEIQLPNIPIIIWTI